MIQILFLFNVYGILLARLFLGLDFMAHGWPKLKNWKQVTGWFDSIGFKPGWFWATVVGIVEFFGGVAILLGFLTQLFSLILAIAMAVALIWNYKTRKNFFGEPELNLALLVLLLLLATLGSGPYSLDHYLGILI